MTSAAAEHNRKVLVQHNFNLEEIINSPDPTVCTPGSEFRDESVLLTLLKSHSNWKELRDTIYGGASNKLKHPPDDQARQAENAALILYNNHKGARDNPDIITKSINDDVIKGYAIPIPCGTELDIDGSMLCAVGTVTQKTLDEMGRTTEKDRLFHDQTFIRLPSSLSVNKLTNKLEFVGLHYGWTFYRILEQTIEMRRAFPDCAILVIKGDFKSAYRRIHYNALAAAQCMVFWGGIIYMWLRLCFGGSSCPPSWRIVGEAIIDIANDLLMNEAFEVDIIKSRYFREIKDKQFLPESPPLAQSRSTIARPPTRSYGAVDIYVDDIIGICVDANDNVQRLSQAMFASVDAICRPPDNQEQPPRPDCLHLSKTIIEGLAAQMQHRQDSES